MTRSYLAVLALTFLALASAPVAVDSQITGTCPTANQQTFNQCLIISILDSNNQTGSRDPKSACAPIANDQANYYCCLCHNYQRVVGCFESNCPAATELTSIRMEQLQYCGACSPTAPQPSASVNSSNTVAFPTLSGTAGARPTATGSSGTQATATTSPTPLKVPDSGASTLMAGVAAVAAGLVGAAALAL
ncbi:hypothetical protein HK097_004609 [Rhizophlyctis rosea]|uniref:Uncharacterized protein n=1 Tax=Rhizophlyctis rosea TaxID=64517 RepID=A0AAD5X901_9FUNG|nr:hypothetical protein HK097_004609 [Rhizophlyctis rosea]